MKKQTYIPAFISLAAIVATYIAVRKKSNSFSDEHRTTTEPAPNTSTVPNPSYNTRGYRNNNPLNIVATSTEWLGEIKPSSDPRFAQFRTMAYGYRAALKLITNYINLYGLNTVAKIIGRWDNAAAANYTNMVCQFTGWPANKAINPNNKLDMTSLVLAMSKVENGSATPVPADAIYEGWALLHS